MARVAVLPPLSAILESGASRLLEIAREASAGQSGQMVAEVPLWEPFPGPQTRAYVSLADELYYGGGGGGGKTDLELGLATTQHRSSIIFRKEFTQFRGAKGIIERSEEIIGLRGSLNRSTMLWTGLPGGRSLEFGAVKTPRDLAKYRGRPHDLKAFDELPEFLETEFRFLIGWLRSSVPGQRLRVVGTGNPPTTPEGEWVVRYWAPWLDPQHPNPAQDGELRWFITDAEGKDQEVPGPTEDELRAGAQRPRVMVGEREVEARSRTFIKARVEDNPVYMATGYDQVLNSLPEPLRSQLRDGNFEAGVEDDKWQVIPTAWVIAAQKRWKAVGGLGRVLDQVGVDPSRGGKDEFVVASRFANWLGPLEVHQGREAPDGATGAALVYKDIQGDRRVRVQVDILGSAGSSVFDHSRTLGLNVVPLDGTLASEGRDKSGQLKFANVRAELHWRMREMLDPNSGEDLALPPDPQLRADLCAARWRPTSQGIRVELKEEIQKRIGRSPDRGEAAMYACVYYVPPGPKPKPKAGVLW